MKLPDPPVVTQCNTGEIAHVLGLESVNPQFLVKKLLLEFLNGLLHHVFKLAVRAVSLWGREDGSGA